MASFMHSREGVTQGDPLDMVAYSIGIIPLIKNLKAEHILGMLMMPVHWLRLQESGHILIS